MKNPTYRVTVNGDVRMMFSADFRQASCPIMLEGRSTPFQVADARHDPVRAAEMLNRWCESQGGGAWDDGDEIEVEVDEIEVEVE